VFYLKYRPQKISELDLTQIREGLARTLTSSLVPHAFLFVGPKGTGKTSAARIVAKAVNCLGRTEKIKNRKTKKQSSVEPCNRCLFCKSIANLTALDLIEIDAASNRGIDDIRDLREKIKLAPSQAKYKVYIIDEVHMLTNEAFNALLKTLEEPPEHAIFILCTTEPQKLPPTIIDRCLRFNFTKGKPEEIIRSLNKVVRGEKLRIDPEALKTIADWADGSFRDGQKILEQLALRKRKITLSMVKEELGKSQAHQPEVLLKFLTTKSSGAALEELGKAVEAGINLRDYTQELLFLLRDCLLSSVGSSPDRGSPCQSLQLNKEEAVRLIELFLKAGRELKTAIIPQLPLELAIIEWCGDGGEDNV
jgi:DNA polymerase-3 subunit gamma/tau